MRKKVRNKKGLKEQIYCHTGNNTTHTGVVYGLGFIGAVVYYISTASGFWMGVLGFLKALVWPAFLIYELFKFLGM